jgi:hypothetical protein
MNNADPIKIVEAKTSAQKKAIHSLSISLIQRRKKLGPAIVNNPKEIIHRKKYFLEEKSALFFSCLKK